MILVTGATGNVGSELVPILLEAGEGVRAITRDAMKARFSEQVEVVSLDLKNSDESVDHIFDGVGAVFLNPASIKDPSSFIESARQAGVRRIVLLSAMVIDDNLPWEEQTGFIARRHKHLEGLIEASGLEWTHVRSNMLMSNAFFEIGPHLRKGNVVTQPYGDAHSAPVDERDVAAVAAKALLEDGHHGMCYELTGPSSVTERDKVRLIAEATGRPISFKEITHQEAAVLMLASFPVQHSNGLAEEHIETVLNYAAAAVDVPAAISPTVENLLERPPYSYNEWAHSRRDRFPASADHALAN